MTKYHYYLTLTVIVFIFGLMHFNTPTKTLAEESNSNSDFKLSTLDSLQQDDSRSFLDNITLESSTVVSNWNELSNALSDSTVSYIIFNNDISDAPSGQIITLGRSNNSKIRNLTINGNGHQINFKNSYFQFYNQTIPKNSDYTLEFKNMHIYQQAPQGFISGNNVNTHNNNNNAGALTYIFEDVDYTGAQMISAYYSDVQFKGHITANSVSKYEYEGNYYNATQQEVIEASSVTFDDYTKFTASNNIYGLINLSGRGDFAVGNYAEVNLISNSTNDIINSSNFIVGRESSVLITSNGRNQSAINLGSSRSNSPSILIGDHSKLMINVNEAVGGTSNPVISTGTRNNSTFVIKQFGECLVNLTSGTSSYASILNMRGNSCSLTINDNASLKAESSSTSSGEGFNAHFFQFGDSYRLNVLDSGKFDAKIINSPSLSDGMTFGSNSALEVSNNAFFNLETGMTDASSYGLNFGTGSSLSVKKAKLFNIAFLSSRLTSNSYLIRLPQRNQGILFENQDISAVQNNRGNYYASEKYGELKWLNISKLYIPTTSAASSGSVVSQTSNSHSASEIDAPNERVKSSLLCNFFLANYQRLTLESPTTDKEENTVDATSWDELNNAVINQSVTRINVVHDITNEETSSPGIDRLIPKKGLLINGNDHYVDFRGISFYNNDPIAANVTMGLDIEHLKMYGQNFYGPFKYSGSTSARSSSRREYGYGYLRYSDSSYQGAQLTASYTYDIIFAGHFTNESLADSYRAPKDNNEYPTQGSPQINIEATNIIFEDEAHYDGSSEDAGVFYLGSGGGITLGKKSTVNIKTIDKKGAVGEYGNAVLSLDGGGLFCNDNSTLNISTRSSQPQSAINIRSSQGSLLLNKSSTLNIALNDQFSSNIRNTTIPIININSSTLKVSEFATLNILGNIQRSGSSKSSTVGIISQTGSSSLEVDEYGTLNIDLDGDSQNLSVLKAASSGKINFSSAKKVNIDISKMPAFDDRNRSNNINLIEMSGYLDATYHKISAWNTSNNKNPDYIWNPVYGVRAQYNGTNITTNIVAKSKNQSIINSVKNNFKTQNFNHILFEGYPDILITIDYLTNDRNLINSHTIKGVTEPNALVVFYGDKAIPKSTLSSYDITDKNSKFHVIADENGNFEFRLPENTFFTAGNTVTATAFSQVSGKSVTTLQKVLTQSEVPKDSDFISIMSVPDISFGNHTITNRTELITSMDNQIIIIDGLKPRQASWKLNFKVSALKNEDGEPLPASYWFGDKLIEAGSNETIYNKSNIEKKQYKLDFKPTEGFKLNVDLSRTTAQKYIGEATWSIVIGP